jgi:hypothetical protein
MRVLFISFFIATSILGINFTNAQGVPAGVNGLDLSLSTDNPIPEQNITITAKSFSIDINSATLTWIIDGKIIQKGIGMTTLETKAPSLGKENRVLVTAVNSNGISFNSTITISSGSIDLIIENNGYTPATFRGKIPTSYQNNVNIIAYPHLADSKGIEYDPKTLIYQWKKNSREQRYFIQQHYHN